MKNPVFLIGTLRSASSSIWVQSQPFGDGRAMVGPVLKQAVEKFATFTPGSDFPPMWGQTYIGYV